MVTILNTSILTAPGRYEMSPVTLQEAKALVAGGGFASAVGHQSTAEIISELLEVPVPMNRVIYEQQPGEVVLVFKLSGRPPEGAILGRAELEEIGYSFFKLIRES